MDDEFKSNMATETIEDEDYDKFVEKFKPIIRTVGKEKTQLYGAGFLISEAKAKAKAEAKAEAIQHIELSDDERAIIERLGEFD